MQTSEHMREKMVAGRWPTMIIAAGGGVLNQLRQFFLFWYALHNYFNATVNLDAGSEPCEGLNRPSSLEGRRLHRTMEVARFSRSHPVKTNKVPYLLVLPCLLLRKRVSERMVYAREWYLPLHLVCLRRVGLCRSHPSCCCWARLECVRKTVWWSGANLGACWEAQETIVCQNCRQFQNCNDPSFKQFWHQKF